MTRWPNSHWIDPTIWWKQIVKEISDTVTDQNGLWKWLQRKALGRPLPIVGNVSTGEYPRFSQNPVAPIFTGRSLPKAGHRFSQSRVRETDQGGRNFYTIALPLVANLFPWLHLFLGVRFHTSIPTFFGICICHLLMYSIKIEEFWCSKLELDSRKV